MGVLFLSSYITIDSRPEFARNKTGFGYMVYDIAASIARVEEVDMLVADVRYKPFTRDGIRFVGISIRDLVANCFKVLPLRVLTTLLRKYKSSSGTAVRLVYYWIQSGYLRKVIRQGNYDIVHIHGCGLQTEIWMEVCKRMGQKFLVTLHGLNSFSDTVRVEEGMKQYEREFLKRVVDGEFPITVISTGIKRQVENAYGVRECQGISVVCNSFHLQDHGNNSLDVRGKYGIPEDAKLLLYVGNVSLNKNQSQMIRAFARLSEEMKRRTYVLFCGRAEESLDLAAEIAKVEGSSHLLLCGTVPKDQMPYYYQAADGVVLLSFAEGFGLSLVEGMHFGLPCVMFMDMDAYEDIYDPCAVVAVGNRDDAAVTSGLLQLLSASWDKEAIKKSAARFDSSHVAQKYVSTYQFVIGR